MRWLAVFVAVWLATGAGCAGAQGSGAGATVPGALPDGDVPFELAYDQDLEVARDEFRALAEDAPERPALRRALADEYARRLRAALDDPEHHYEGFDMLMALASLWTAAELAAGAPDMAAYADDARRVRAVFAPQGGDLQVAAALYFLQAAGVEQHPEELGELFAFADELSVAQFGDGAEHARPIEILESIVPSLPSRPVVDELVRRIQLRQSVLLARFRDGGPTPDLIRAHGAGLFSAAATVTAALTRGGRLDEVPTALAGLESLGADAEVADKVAAVLAADASADDWLALAASYENEDPERAQPESRLVILRAGVRALPDSAPLHYKAAAAADALDWEALATALYERGYALAPSREGAERLAELYTVRVSALALAERPEAAYKALSALERFHAEAAERWPEKPLEADLAEAYAAMGRGLLGLGALKEARAYFRDSQQRRENIEALSLLGTIAFKRDALDEARGHFRAALALPVESVYERLEAARILRQLGDTLAALGQSSEAAARWSESIDRWLALGQEYSLPPGLQGELMVEVGKASWSLGHRDNAVRAFENAVDVDPEGTNTHTSVVSFFLMHGQYQRALDAYHRALGNHGISDYAKVYMSLWVVAEARRRDQPADALASAFLEGRDGPLWYDALARYATERMQHDDLVARARTRGRQAEMWYYEAVLGETQDPEQVRALLQRVLDSGMVLFFEYDMARSRLGEVPAR